VHGCGILANEKKKKELLPVAVTLKDQLVHPKMAI
jgi:hypothetical protein